MVIEKIENGACIIVWFNDGDITRAPILLDLLDLIDVEKETRKAESMIVNAIREAQNADHAIN